jgi:hypothetical protein
LKRFKEVLASVSKRPHPNRLSRGFAPQPSFDEKNQRALAGSKTGFG